MQAQNTPETPRIDHRKQAVEAFNATWDLIEKTDRSPEEALQMIHLAHASRFHWGFIGTPTHFTRGEWQISRVYALLKMGESALFHAKFALDYCEKNQIGDFDRVFAFEAMARAHAVSGDPEKAKQYLKKAHDALEDVKEEEDRTYCLSELKTIEV